MKIEPGDTLRAGDHTARVLRVTDTAVVTSDGARTAVRSVENRVRSEHFDVELLKA